MSRLAPITPAGDRRFTEVAEVDQAHSSRREGKFVSSNFVSGSGPRAGRKEWIGLSVLALPTLLLALDMSVLYLALQHLAADLQPTSTQTLWIVDIYGFMIAGFLITMGTLGDRIGRRTWQRYGV